MGRGWPIAAEIDGSHVTASAGEEDEGSHDERSRVLRIDLGHTLGRIYPLSRLAGVICTCCNKDSEKRCLLELITFEILASERLRLMGFDN